MRQTRELTRKLSYQASHDTLTGLFNRYEFENRLREALELAQVENTPITLCYMDLDQFKIVNDTCGHIAGDELLRQLSHVLKDQLRDTDTIARLGGDEFGVLLPGCSLGNAEHLTAKLQESVREYNFTWDGKTFEVGVSIGVVPISTNTRDVTEALSAADVACYAAKENGRDCVHVYEADDDALQRKRDDMQWVSRIRQALKEDRFRLFQQPIVPVSQSVSDTVCHHEVLLRMLDEEGELIAPGQFLGSAEQFGLMADIDKWVLRHTLDWLSAHTTAQQGHRLAINLSGQSMSSNNFLENAILILQSSGVNLQQICFEITETAAIANLDKAVRFIKSLRSMGCEFALDDFGSGMSSFSYLKNLPVNYLKIDGSYVRDVVKNPIDRSMVEAVNQIGHAMGMKTIAEFVEDEATLGALAVIGVDYAQGLWHCKTCPPGQSVRQQHNAVTQSLTPGILIAQDSYVYPRLKIKENAPFSLVETRMSFQVSIKPSGHSFPVEPGQTILDAAIHHSIGLPYGCRNGACGSCIATLLSGTVSYPEGTPDALVPGSPADQIVICQAVATSDLVIRVREVQAGQDISVKTLPCRAEHLQRLSHDVMQVQLKLPESERLQFLAGQYIEFILKDGRRRAFSIANAPHQDDFLELHIRHVPGGSFTGHVFDEMKDRALLRIEGPLGSFFLREESPRPIIMMAGGTGIAPLKGILEHAFYIGFDRPIHLFWGVKEKRDLYMDDLPKAWANKYPQFRYTAVLSDPEEGGAWQGETGFVSDAVVQAYPQLGEFDIYMSGPPAMIEAATPVFAEHGAHMDHMYSDAFEFASDILDKIRRND